jgi:polyhydroxyalkanoate synthesis regulator phasin
MDYKVNKLKIIYQFYMKWRIHMSRSRFILSALFLISICFLIAGKPVYAYAEENNTICKGVFIDEVDVSGMTKDQAKAAVEDFIKEIQGKQIAVRVLNEVVYSTVGDLGYNTDAEKDIDEAISLGKSGNLIKRYKDLKDIEQGNVVYPLSFQYDTGKIKDLVVNKVSAFNIAPVNASVTRKGGKFVYTDHVVGSKVNVDETTRVIEDTLKQWNRQEVVVDAVV